ncbi:hypothetical protein BKA70DRAFT_282527 [Coprinopsis sp. MPI-PUGE-AT-0042]|nr:hypothetical protein BKA70DRAFT_282527 [Coprinopsis sp. MPI-PUGE-AT-0042]
MAASRLILSFLAAAPASFSACRPSISSNIPSLASASSSRCTLSISSMARGMSLFSKSTRACPPSCCNSTDSFSKSALASRRATPSSATDFSKEALPRTTDASPRSRPPLPSQSPIVTICSALQSSRLQLLPETSLLSLPMS